jgi:hypothetical protein
MKEVPVRNPESVVEKISIVPWKLVTHKYPDTDAWACLWAAAKFLVPQECERQLVFARAGEMLTPENSVGFTVLYMDTGGGDCDQHGKLLARGSSFQLLAEKYDFASDPGILPILELTLATDNVEFVSPTSIHYFFKGLPFHFKDPKSNEVDWEAISDRVFEVLDIIYGQALLRAESAEKFSREGRNYRLSNRLRVSSVWWNPGLREAAFDQNSDVVMWTEGRGKKRFDVGIQVSRRSAVVLTKVVGAIRLAEGAKRGLAFDPAGAESFGTISTVPGWFLHDSGKLILCGSRSHRLERYEHTQLSPHEILGILRTELAKLPGYR